jgi:hypothetical protein
LIPRVFSFATISEADVTPLAYRRSDWSIGPAVETLLLPNEKRQGLCLKQGPFYAKTLHHAFVGVNLLASSFPIFFGRFAMKRSVLFLALVLFCEVSYGRTTTGFTNPGGPLNVILGGTPNNDNTVAASQNIVALSSLASPLSVSGLSPIDTVINVSPSGGTTE